VGEQFLIVFFVNSKRIGNVIHDGVKRKKRRELYKKD
jgi:hypothetical protein